MNHFHGPRISLYVLARVASLFVLVALLPPAAHAQPFGSWLALNGTTSYAQTPHAVALNPTSALTIEGWAMHTIPGTTEDCRTLVGKSYQQAYWIGICSGQIRSYVRGGSSAMTGGRVPSGRWFHWAVTTDGTTRKHYVNGEERLSQAEGAAGALGQSTAALRLGSDVSWEFEPQGALDEVRIWNRVRTKAEIRATMLTAITAAQPNLVANFHFDGTPVGGYPLTLAGGAGYLTLPVGGSCVTNATTLCLGGGRFAVTGDWMTATDLGTAKVVTGHTSAESGMFWFFNSTNWEVLVKVLNGCGVNNHHWAFSAATTDVNYQLTVIDQARGKLKRYANFQGTAAPAITDTGAFQTCP